MPYVLRTFLADRVNFPGRNTPGRGLVRWMYLICAVSVVGVALRVVTDQVDFWVLKKCGDALTFVPVLRTLRLYDRVSTVEAACPGRGPILSQILLVIECYCLVVHSSDIALRVLKIAGVVDWTQHVFYHSMYSTSNHYAVCTRLLGHSILLNVIDESSTCCPRTTQPAEEEAETEESNTEEVALVGVIV